MNSYKVIFGSVAILLCVAIFAGYAGIAFEGDAYGKVPEHKEMSDQDRGFLLNTWESFCEQFWGGTIGQMINPDDGVGIGFLWSLATFSVPDMPVVFSWVFWFLTIALVVAITRVVVGLVTGGGG